MRRRIRQPPYGQRWSIHVNGRGGAWSKSGQHLPNVWCPIVDPFQRTPPISRCTRTFRPLCRFALVSGTHDEERPAQPSSLLGVPRSTQRLANAACHVNKRVPPTGSAPDGLLQRSPKNAGRPIHRRSARSAAPGHSLCDCPVLRRETRARDLAPARPGPSSPRAREFCDLAPSFDWSRPSRAPRVSVTLPQLRLEPPVSRKDVRPYPVRPPGQGEHGVRNSRCRPVRPGYGHQGRRAPTGPLAFGTPLAQNAHPDRNAQ